MQKISQNNLQVIKNRIINKPEKNIDFRMSATKS